MSAEEAKRLAYAWYKAANDKDLDTIAAISSDDITLEYPGSAPQSGLHRGKASILEMWRRSFRAVPNLTFELKYLTAEGGTVAVEWLSSATTWDGRPYSNRGCSVIVVRDGKIVERREYVDTERARAMTGPPE